MYTKQVVCDQRITEPTHNPDHRRVLFQGSQKKKKANSFETPERTAGVTTQLNLHWYENSESYRRAGQNAALGHMKGFSNTV